MIWSDLSSMYSSQERLALIKSNKHIAYLLEEKKKQYSAILHCPSAISDVQNIPVTPFLDWIKLSLNNLSINYSFPLWICYNAGEN